MTVLFRDGTLLQKLGVVAQLTFEHTVNLASFVGVYKLILALGRWANGALSIPVSTSAGMPANGLHAFLAGCIGEDMSLSVDHFRPPLVFPLICPLR